MEGLAIPLGTAPLSALGEAQKIVQEVVAGSASLEQQAALRTSASYSSPRWVDPSRSEWLEPKVRLYLSELSVGGLTVPFQLNGRFPVLRLIERQDPEPLAL